LQISAKVIGLTFLGGAVGTWLRWVIATALDNCLITTNEAARTEQALASTLIMLFVVNLSGAAALGFFNRSRHFSSDARQAFFGIGLAGGYTTMSGVALWLMVSSGNSALFGLGAWFNIALVAAMFIAGIAVYRLGGKWAR
jgi:fluoride ion exporter CrcB/FEX